MAQPVFVSLTRLDGTAVTVDATDQISDLVPVSPMALPAGVTDGTYINFASGRAIAVQGSVAAIASQLGTYLSGFTGMLRMNNAGIQQRSGYFAGWTLVYTPTGIYTLSPPAGTVISSGSIGLIAMAENAAGYYCTTFVTALPATIVVRAYDATGTPANATVDLLLMSGLT